MKKRYIVGLLLSSMLLLNLIYSAESRKIIVRGWVDSWDWNEQDEIIQVVVLVQSSQTDNYEDDEYIESHNEYVVVNDVKGKALIPFVGSFAEVRGSWTTDADSLRILTVESYRILEDEPEDYIGIEFLND